MHYLVSLLAFFCLTVHAFHIDARNLRLGDQGADRNPHSFAKDLVQERHYAPSRPSSLRSLLSDELQAQARVDNSVRKIAKNSVGIYALQQKDSYAFKNKEHPQKATSGTKIELSPIKENLDLPSIKRKDSQRQERSMLGDVHQDAKEAVDALNKNLEDITDMDYAQPHRKPPIHNEKP